MNFHNRDDGGIFTFILQSVAPGQVINFQAKGSGTMILAQLGAQPVAQYTVLGTTVTTPQSFVGNANPYSPVWTTISDTPLVALNALSLSGPSGADPNQRNTCGWGFATFALTTSSGSAENETKVNFYDNLGPVFGDGSGDIGQAVHSPDTIADVYRDSVGWACAVGLRTDRTYRVPLQSRGLCGTKTYTAARRTHQVLVLPSPQDWSQACTDSHPWPPGEPPCPYQCAINLALQMVSIVGADFCNVN